MTRDKTLALLKNVAVTGKGLLRMIMAMPAIWAVPHAWSAEQPDTPVI